jgi:hypothetical protein
MSDEISVSAKIPNAVRFATIHSTKVIEFYTVEYEDGFIFIPMKGVCVNEAEEGV